MDTIRTRNGIFTLHEESVYINNHTRSGEVYEGWIINGILPKFINKSKYILDIGANIGIHAVSYAGMNSDAEIWAFEPQETVFKVLENNVIQNNFSERIHTMQVAVGHTIGEIALCDLNATHVKVEHGIERGSVRIGSNGENVKMITVDSLNLPGLDFMKIDIEGAEGLAILGAAETIKKFKPVIFFEHNEQFVKAEDCGLECVPTPFHELRKLGYDFFTHVGWENWVALPMESSNHRSIRAY